MSDEREKELTQKEIDALPTIDWEVDFGEGEEVYIMRDGFGTPTGKVTRESAYRAEYQRHLEAVPHIERNIKTSQKALESHKRWLNDHPTPKGHDQGD